MSQGKHVQNRELLYKFPLRDNRYEGVVDKAVIMMIVSTVGLVLIFVGLWGLTKQRAYYTHVMINTDCLVHKTDERFLSITIDASKIQDGWVHENIKSGKLLRLATLLAPAYLRVGGTLADRLVFQPHGNYSTMPHASNMSDGGTCSYELKGCVPSNISFFSMSGADWTALNTFAQSAGLELLFDLNVLLRNQSQWDSSNARQLIEFSDKFGFNVSWQLGNEPNSFLHVFGTTVPADQLAQDFMKLSDILWSYPRYRKSLIVGPDVTHPRLQRQTFEVQEKPMRYLRNFLNKASRVINAITWHQYYLNGRKARLEDFVSPDVLNVLACQISAVLKVTTGIPLPIWLSETGSAYGGGTAGLSDRYVAGFLWLDKLGMAARLGLDVVMRQSLYGSNYGLVDKDVEPLPDWWISVLYKKLVGPAVLGMDTDNILHTKCEGEQGHVRLYCHCARQHGAVTLFGMNLLNQEAHVTLTGLPFAKSVLAYVLTADIILKSRHILLNGKELQLNPDGSLPEFEPKVLNISKPLIMPVFSMAFWVIEDVYAPACHKPSKAVPARYNVGWPTYEFFKYES
ncbi:heparanase-like isoform X2 [Periplaneta americana]|uniref:heparanase-like isoform X2 n=1 Tax=Periplaneta americana TaxID=6978 RepID=UPI0037E95C73